MRQRDMAVAMYEHMAIKAEMLKMSDADYFALEALNHSSLRWLIDDTPAHFRYRMDNPQHDPTPDMEFGTAVHSLVLGGPEVVPVDADNWRTKAAQEMAAECRVSGRVPLLVKDYERAIACRDAVFQHPIAGKLVATMNHAEVVIRWDEGGVSCKAKVDGISGRFGWDLKTSYSADAESFGRSAAKYGYATQEAFYRRALRAAGIEGVEFVFCIVEKVAPYLVSVVKLDSYDVELADKVIDRALDTYRRCVETGEWPGYPDGIQTAQLPRWAELEMETE